MPTFIHKKTQNKVNISEKVQYVYDLPFKPISANKFEKMSTVNKEKVLEEIVKKDNLNRKDIKIFDVCAIFETYTLVVNIEMTWNELKEYILQRIQRAELFDNSDQIDDVALSNYGCYVEGKSKVIDDRVDMPWNVIPDESMIYVLMLKRHTVAWKPIMIGYNMCEGCGKVTDLKCCSFCKEVYYCSKECQQKDWPEHKKTCVKK